MKCLRCEHESVPGANFCGECGARLEMICPACGAANMATHNFCQSCGETLLQPSPRTRYATPERYTPKHLSERILSSRTALEGERKHITVLFADLKGSMELLAGRDPEEARNILDPVLEHMIEAVHRYEGTVNQVMGDGIMALFGAPLAHEDHGVRACYAALRMQDSLRRYAEEIQRAYGVTVQIRIGLNSGEVVVRTIGGDLRMDYTAVGQSTHLAARMEQAAKPGSTLITAATLRLAEGYVNVKPLGKLHVKGAGPVDAYELVGAQAVRSRIQAAVSRGLTRFVGRDAELDSLARAWQRAAAGHGQIVAFIGEAGVGKSRLFHEFARSRPREAWLILESGSVSYGKATPYLPIVELLRSYFKVGAQDDHRSIRDKVTGKLVALDESLQSCIAAVLALLDTPTGDPDWQKLDPVQRRQRTLNALKRLLLRESRVQPLLLVFEDLHWIDHETQTLLNGLVESLPHARILLVVNYRPGYEHEWGSRSYYMQHRIDPLQPEGAEDLLGAMLGDDPTVRPLKRLLAERSSGNPFFLEETVRSFIEVGALVGASGAYRFRGAPTAMHVPATVQPVIAERIDRLAHSQKQLLQAATVIGTTVPFPLLEAICDLTEDGLRQGLAELQSSEFLYETALFPEPEYTFKHALTHEVAYGTLLHERRRSLHARVAGAIERLYADRLEEHVERVAHHAMRGEIWDKAVEYSAQAGAKAAAKSAHREAVARYTDALHALERLPRERSGMQRAFDLRFSLRTSLSPLGEFDRSFEQLCEAERIARELEDEGRLARVLTFKALYYWSIGQQDRALDAAHGAMELADAAGDVPSQILAKLFAGRARHARGEYAQAVALFEWVARATDSDRANYFGMANLPSVGARTWLAWSLAERGELDAAMAWGREGVSIAETAADLVSEIYAHMAVGIVHLRRGDAAAAEQMLASAYHAADRAQLEMARAMVAGYLGRCYTLTGRAADAVPLLKDAIAAAAGMQLMVDQATRLVHLADAWLRIGDTEQARAVAEQALASADAHGERAARAWAHWVLAEICRACGASGDAVVHCRAAAAVASELGLSALVEHCRSAATEMCE